MCVALCVTVEEFAIISTSFIAVGSLVSMFFSLYWMVPATVSGPTSFSRASMAAALSLVLVFNAAMSVFC